MESGWMSDKSVVLQSYTFRQTLITSIFLKINTFLKQKGFIEI